MPDQSSHTQVTMKFHDNSSPLNICTNTNLYLTMIW